MIDTLRRRWDLLLLVALQLLFWSWPQLDLLVSGWFYRPEAGFLFDHSWPVQLSYRVFAELHWWVFGGLVWLLIASWWWAGRRERGLRRRLWFLLLVLLLGPGLLVNGVLKTESGRARPAAVAEFGGQARFTPAFEAADQCRSNCSFVSGHAAMGFWFIALAWALRDRRWLVYGLLLGALVGLGRIAQGGHFLSDVVFAFWVVYGVSWLLGRWMLGQDGPERPA